MAGFTFISFFVVGCLSCYLIPYRNKGHRYFLLKNSATPVSHHRHRTLKYYNVFIFQQPFWIFRSGDALQNISKGRLMLRLSHINPHASGGAGDDVHSAINIICVKDQPFSFPPISRTCAFVTVPALARGVFLPEPFSIPAALMRSEDAGGVFITNENVRSSYTEISTGTISPTIVLVFALNSVTNCPMFTPACPNAGPSGGAGVAFPAGIWSFIFVTFLP